MNLDNLEKNSLTGEQTNKLREKIHLATVAWVRGEKGG